MQIAVIQDNDVENEFELGLCCAACAQEQYGWSAPQFTKVKSAILAKTPISIPASIQTLQQFIAHIKTT